MYFINCLKIYAFSISVCVVMFIIVFLMVRHRSKYTYVYCMTCSYEQESIIRVWITSCIPGKFRVLYVQKFLELGQKCTSFTNKILAIYEYKFVMICKDHKSHGIFVPQNFNSCSRLRIQFFSCIKFVTFTLYSMHVQLVQYTPSYGMI